jgi:hypothetical protein
MLSVVAAVVCYRCGDGCVTLCAIGVATVVCFRCGDGIEIPVHNLLAVDDVALEMVLGCVGGCGSTKIVVIVMYGKFQWGTVGIMSALEIADVFLGWLTRIQEIK